MTSALRTAANRRNALRSTGPRTPAGKARSAQNARRHELNRPAAEQAEFAQAISSLAHLIAGVGVEDGRLAAGCSPASEAAPLLERPAVEELPGSDRGVVDRVIVASEPLDRGIRPGRHRPAHR